MAREATKTVGIRLSLTEHEELSAHASRFKLKPTTYATQIIRNSLSDREGAALRAEVKELRSELGALRSEVSALGEKLTRSVLALLLSVGELSESEAADLLQKPKEQPRKE